MAKPKRTLLDLEVKYSGIIFSKSLIGGHHTGQDPLVQSQRGYGSQKPAVTCVEGAQAYHEQDVVHAAVQTSRTTWVQDFDQEHSLLASEKHTIPVFNPPPARPSYPEPLDKYLSSLLPHQ